MTESFPIITVVVPIKNEERYIARTLEFLLNQDYPKDKVEILVGVGDCDDRTAEVVKKIEARESRVKYFYNPVGLSSGARALGAEMANGEIVLYVDGHVWIESNQILKSTVRLMSEKEVDVLSRPQFLDTPENTFFQKAVALARKSTIGHGLDSTIYTTEAKYVDPSSSGAAYKKTVFEKIGNFDTRFDACEDFEFNFRCSKAGYKSFTSMDLAVFYYPRNSLGALFRQMKRYGVGRFRLAQKHPSSLGVGTIIPFLFTVGLPLLGALSFVHRYFFYLFLLMLIPYGLGIVLSSAVIAAKNGWIYFPVLLPIYPAIHFGLGWGFLVEMVRYLTGRGKNFKEKAKG